MNTENILAPIKDLFGTLRWLRPGTINSKPLDERAGAIKFFQDQKFKHKDGTLFTGKDLGIRCGHLTIEHLYVVQSVYKDIKRREGYEKAAKYFFGITKTQKICS